MRIFLAFVLSIITCSIAFGQKKSTTEHSFTNAEIQGCLFYQQQHAAGNIYNLIIYGKLKSYKDRNLTIKTNTDSFSRLTFEMKSIANPNDSNDIYYYMPQSPERAWFNFTSSTVFGYIFTYKDTLYVNYSNLLTLLNDEDRAFIQFLNLRKKDYREYVGLALPDEYNYLRDKIYNLAVSSTVKSYANDSLQKVLSSDELEKRKTVKAVIQIINPNNPDDIYDLIDTIIIADSVKNLNKLVLLQKWEYTPDKKAISQPIAIAPAFSPGIQKGQIFVYPYYTAFWVKWEDLQKHFAPEELHFYEYLFFYTLKEAVGK